MAKEYSGAFTGAGKGLNYIGKDLAYAYSGGVTVDGTDEVALDFKTGSETIDSKIMVQYIQDASDGDDSKVNIELNGVKIAGNIVGANYGEPTNTMGPENWVPLIIPPFSRLRVLFTMLSGGGSIVLGVTLTGKVHA